MGSTALVILNKCLLKLGENELSGEPDFTALTGNRKIILQHVQQTQNDIAAAIDFRELRGTEKQTLVEDQLEYDLPSDIMTNNVQYMYVVNTNDENQGFIEMIEEDDWRKRNYRAAPSYTPKFFLNGSSFVFTKKPTSTNPMISPKTSVDQTSASGTKTLYVASTTDFAEGGKIIIAEGTAREERAVIDSITDGVSLTLEENLTYDHSAANADEVDGSYRIYLVYKKQPTSLAAYDDVSDIPSEFDILYEIGTFMWYNLTTAQFDLYQSYAGILGQEIKATKKKIKESSPVRTWNEKDNFYYNGGW